MKKTIEELEAEQAQLDKDRARIRKEIARIKAKPPAKWQLEFIDRLDCTIDKDFPGAVRFNDELIYCTPGFVSISLIWDNIDASVLELAAEIIRRRQDGEDI